MTEPLTSRELDAFREWVAFYGKVYSGCEPTTAIEAIMRDADDQKAERVARFLATIAADRKRIEAAEELIATMERYPGDAHRADEWYCERMEKDIAAYRDAYPAKKGE